LEDVILKGVVSLFKLLVGVADGLEELHVGLAVEETACVGATCGHQYFMTAFKDATYHTESNELDQTDNLLEETEMVSEDILNSAASIEQQDHLEKFLRSWACCLLLFTIFLHPHQLSLALS